MAFSDLDPESSVVVTDLDGKPVEGDRKSSIEFRFDLGIYKARADLGAVLHAHPPICDIVRGCKSRATGGLGPCSFHLEGSAAAPVFAFRFG